MSNKILIAEDIPINRRLIRDILIYHGHEVIEAENGEEAVRIAREQGPD
jgi:two-component system, cell cycle response regulator DivK